MEKHKMATGAKEAAPANQRIKELEKDIFEIRDIYTDPDIKSTDTAQSDEFIGQHLDILQKELDALKKNSKLEAPTKVESAPIVKEKKEEAKPRKAITFKPVEEVKVEQKVESAPEPKTQPEIVAPQQTEVEPELPEDKIEPEPDSGEVEVPPEPEMAETVVAEEEPAEEDKPTAEEDKFYRTQNVTFKGFMFEGLSFMMSRALAERFEGKKVLKRNQELGRLSEKVAELEDNVKNAEISLGLETQRFDEAISRIKFPLMRAVYEKNKTKKIAKIQEEISELKKEIEVVRETESGEQEAKSKIIEMIKNLMSSHNQKVERSIEKVSKKYKYEERLQRNIELIASIGQLRLNISELREFAREAVESLENDTLLDKESRRELEDKLSTLMFEINLRESELTKLEKKNRKNEKKIKKAKRKLDFFNGLKMYFKEKIQGDKNPEESPVAQPEESLKQAA